MQGRCYSKEEGRPIMYKISEFSNITQLSIKALRYYDEEGLLVPSQRNEQQHRLYSDKDYETARRIIMLREFHFSIQEMKDVLQNCENDEDICYYLQEKMALIKKNILEEKACMKAMESYLKERNFTKQANALYQIQEEICEKIQYAAIPFQGSYDKIKTYVQRLYKELKGNTKGAIFQMYFEEAYDEMMASRLCVDLKKEIKTVPNDFFIGQIQARQVLSLYHIGSYETLHIGYKALLDYAQEHHLHLQLPYWQHYEKGPGIVLKGNPDKYVTKIVVPYERG